MPFIVQGYVDNASGSATAAAGSAADALAAKNRTEQLEAHAADLFGGDVPTRTEMNAALAGKANAEETETALAGKATPEDIANDISAHNTASDAHGDIRTLVDTLQGLITALQTGKANADDVAAALSLKADAAALDGAVTTLGTKANSADLTAHTEREDNPHSVTAEQVGAVYDYGDVFVPLEVVQNSNYRKAYVGTFHKDTATAIGLTDVAHQIIYLPFGYYTTTKYGKQFAFPCSGDAAENKKIYFRDAKAGTWSAWQTLITDKNIGEHAIAELSTKLIPNNTDLNTLTAPGAYYFGSDANIGTLQNCPTDKSFDLFVGASMGSANNYRQIIVNYMGDIYVRVFTKWSNSWRAWNVYYNNRNIAFATAKPSSLANGAISLVYS